MVALGDERSAHVRGLDLVVRGRGDPVGVALGVVERLGAEAPTWLPGPPRPETVRFREGATASRSPVPGGELDAFRSGGRPSGAESN